MQDILAAARGCDRLRARTARRTRPTAIAFPACHLPRGRNATDWLAVGVLAALGAPALLSGLRGRPGQSAPVRRRQAAGSPVSVAITSVSPSYARPGQKVRVRGR